MKRFLILVFLACSLVPVAASAAVSHKATKSSAANSTHAKSANANAVKMSAAQIVSKNVAARGGLKAWRTVQTLSMSGRMEAGGTKNQTLPFVMKMKRPHMNRLEIVFQGKTAMQVYDGESGWKLRPFLGRDEVEPFTPAESKAANNWQELDGPLVDYAKKGTKIALLGTESVEGHKAYKLKLTMKGGEERHIWIDASSFLEQKVEGEPRVMDGKIRNVFIFYRDYKKEKGLTIPHLVETTVDGSKMPHKMYIEHVAVNQSMESALFTKPQLAVTNASLPQAKPMVKLIP